MPESILVGLDSRGKPITHGREEYAEIDFRQDKFVDSLCFLMPLSVLFYPSTPSSVFLISPHSLQR